jgi:hypothetical protein
VKAALLLACAPLVFGACVDTRAPITGTQSLSVTLTSPADPGSLANRLPDSARAVSFDVQALDADGKPDTSFDHQLQVYVNYLGTLTPYLGGTPLATVPMANGKGSASLMLPPGFGPATVWLDDGTDANATYATGVSPTLWYRDPFIKDVQQPVDESSSDALEAGPLDNKNISVNASRYGANGKLVVTSVFSQGYTLADVQCQDANGTPPCTAGDYDYIEVFSYSAPLDQDKRFISEGQIIDGFAGGVTEFDGLTEIGFPQTFVSGAPKVDPRVEPAPVKFDPAWFANTIEFERNEAAVVEIDNAKVCPLDSDYDTFKQWKLDPSGVGTTAVCNGNKVLNVISAGVLTVDPSTLVGKSIPKLLGTLRPINLGAFNVWIFYPRSDADITLQ